MRIYLRPRAIYLQCQTRQQRCRPHDRLGEAGRVETAIEALVGGVPGALAGEAMVAVAGQATGAACRPWARPAPQA